MARYFKMIIICILFLIAAVPASSELYQYKDQNGITRLTDNIYSVPVQYRSQLEAYSEIEDLPDEMEIKPLEKKPSPQAEKEKIVAPKPDKTIPETAEKEITPPDIARKTEPAVEPEIKKSPPAQPVLSEKTAQKAEAESVAVPELKETPSAPVPPAVLSGKTVQKTDTRPEDVPELKKAPPLEKPSVLPEKTVQEAKTGIPDREIYKSARIRIDKKKAPVIQPPAKKPENTLKKLIRPKTPQKLKPLQKTCTVHPPEPKITKEAEIVKEPEIIKDNIGSDKTAFNQTVLKPDIKQMPEKGPASQIINEPAEKAIALTKEKGETTAKAPLPPAKTDQKNHPEKIDQPLKESTAAAPKKEPDIREKAIFENQKQSKGQEKTTADTKKILTQEEKAAKKDSSYLKEQVIEKKTSIVPKAQKAGTEKEIAKAVKSDIRENPVPEIEKKTVSQTDKKIAKETNLIAAALETDQDPLADTEKQTLPIRQTTPELPEPMKNSELNGNETEALTMAEAVETADKEEISEQNESVSLAYLQTTRKLLAEKKEALNKTYLNLMKEKQQLEDSVDEDDENSVLQYNKNVKSLNLKIKQYKQEKKLLQAEIEKYNRMIRQSATN